MYSNKPSFVFGFHGLDKDAAIKILNQQEDIYQSNNSYDWLGTGTYFWENNLERARQYAEEDSKRRTSKIKSPFVIGAIIDLGNCLDLLNQDSLDFISYSYDKFVKYLSKESREIPKNTQFNKNDFDFKKRELDCAVIRYAHELAKNEGKNFDSVRAGFWEGELLYEGAGFRKQNHIQIAVINPNCIKGIFLPRSSV